MTRQKREIEVIRWKKRQGCQGGRISGWSDGEAEIEQEANISDNG